MQCLQWLFYYAASGTYTVTLQDGIGRQSGVGFGIIRDTTPPTLTLAALVQGEVHVTWSATDPDSGVDASTCLLEVREDEGAWQTFSTQCGGDDTHDGQPGHTYTLRLSASDNVGNAASLEVQAVFPYVKKYYYANGQRVAMRQEGVVYYLHSDHLGSTSVLSDGGGQPAGDRVAYLPYGGLRLGDASTLPTDYTFTGQRDEAGLGLMHYGARFYSPRLGRFVSADTIVPNPMSPQNFNRYSYASNNPLRYRDPTGHQNWDAVNEYFMGIAYQIGANNWEAFGVSSVAAVRAGAEEVAQEHSDSMAFEVGRLCGSLGTALQGLGEIGGGITAAEAGVTVSGTGVGALVGVPVAGAGVAVAGHGAVLVGHSVGQAALSAGRLIQMASGEGGGSGKTPRWKVGDPVNAPTEGGYPSWSTVRRRWWKNRAATATPGEFSDANLARMKEGKPPLHEGLLRKGIEVPMELHHTSRRGVLDPHNPSDLTEVWPWEHAAIDPHRYYNGPTP